MPTGSTQKQKNTAIFHMLLCATLWSIAGIFIKAIPWSPFVIAGLRSFFAGIVVLVYIRVKRMRVVVNRQTVTAAVFMAALFLCFVTATKLTTAANATVLQYTAPLFVMVISVLFLHQKLRRVDVAAALCTMIGVSLCFAAQLSGGHLLGNIIAVISGVFMAMMYLNLGRFGPEEKMSYILIGQLFTFLCSLPFFFTTRPVFAPLPALYVVILGVVQLGVPYLLCAWASEHCPPIALSLLSALEPLLNPVWVFLFNGETPGTLALVGGAVVIAAVTAWCILGRDRTPSEQEAANGTAAD